MNCVHLCAVFVYPKNAIRISGFMKRRFVSEIFRCKNLPAAGKEVLLFGAYEATYQKQAGALAAVFV